MQPSFAQSVTGDGLRLSTPFRNQTNTDVGKPKLKLISEVQGNNSGHVYRKYFFMKNEASSTAGKSSE